MKQFKKIISIILSVGMISLSLVQVSHAGMVDTQTVAATQDSATMRDRVRNFLDRADVAAEMQRQGVDASAAKTRIDSLTDSELQTIAGKLDQAPAGGESVLGILFTIFIILLITDILGLTKVFPFTRSIR